MKLFAKRKRRSISDDEKAETSPAKLEDQPTETKAPKASIDAGTKDEIKAESNTKEGEGEAEQPVQEQDEPKDTSNPDDAVALLLEMDPATLNSKQRRLVRRHREREEKKNAPEETEEQPKKKRKRKKGSAPDWSHLPPEERERREEQRRLQKEAAEKRALQAQGLLPASTHAHPLNSERRRALRRARKKDKAKWKKKKAELYTAASAMKTHSREGFMMRKGGGQW